MSFATQCANSPEADFRTGRKQNQASICFFPRQRLTGADFFAGNHFFEAAFWNIIDGNDP